MIPSRSAILRLLLPGILVSWLPIIVAACSTPKLITSPLHLPPTYESLLAPTIDTSTYSSYLPLIDKGSARYVSTSGDDHNPGTFDRPWRTFAKATSMISAGAVVHIRGGVYHEPLNIRASGTQSSPIEFSAYPGEYPVIDGEKRLPVSYQGLVHIEGDWVQVSGLEVRSSKYRGVDLEGKHVTVTDVYVHHSQENGVFIFGDYGTVENSRIWRNALSNEFGRIKDGGKYNWGTGLSAGRDFADGYTDHAVMKNNISWENWGEGVSSFEATHTTIEDNISHDNWSLNIYINDSTDVLCQRNFVYNNPESDMYRYGATGIGMADEYNNPPSANITVINNIVYGSDMGYFWWQQIQGSGMNNVLIANNTFISDRNHAVAIHDGNHHDVRFENNIIQQVGSVSIASVGNSPELYFSNNLWSERPPNNVVGPGDIIGDPMWLNGGSVFAPEWFRLASTSPAIGHALSLPEVPVDYFLNPRDTSPDMGAVEYVYSK